MLIFERPAWLVKNTFSGNMRKVNNDQAVSWKYCLVTGYTGFVGRHIIQSLRESGCRARGLSRHPRSESGATDLEVFQGDLTRPETLRGVAENIDTIIHAAGYAHSAAGPSGIHRQVTLMGTRHLLAEAEKSGVRRFIFVSSVKAMPEPGTDCLDETAEAWPEDEYGLSRRQAEELVLEAGRRSGMHVSILRPALVYGPGCKGNLASMLRWIDRGLFPPVPDTGNRRSMVDVRDLVRAILLAASEQAADGATFLITDGEDYTTRRIYTGMSAALGKCVPGWSVPAPVLRALGRMGDAYELLLRRAAPFNSMICSRLLDSACYRSNRATSDLGFSSAYKLEDALPAMVHAYRQQANRKT
jgi:nucleoside-diphosphate-sugar epimerase